MLKEHLKNAKGFISAEGFSSLATEGKLLSMSVWKNEESVKEWRNLADHRMSQKAGRMEDFIAYKITILFSYDDKLKCSNNKGFLLATS